MNWDAGAYARNFNFVPEYGRELINILAPQKGERILDLGCGTGKLTADIASRGCTVVGVDRDASMIGLARQSYPALEFHQQDAHRLGLTESFDGVFSNAALHWMKIGDVFPEVARVLRQGGRIAAEMGGVGNIAAIERAIYQGLSHYDLTPQMVPMPWTFSTPAHVAQTLESAGFEVRYMNLYDRLTLLGAEAGGIKGWVRMFGRAILEQVSGNKHEELLQFIEDAAHDDLYRDGNWYADYRRFHFIAVKL